MFAPSIATHAASGAIIFVGIVVFLGNYDKFNIYQMLVLIILFSIVIGIHSISHLGLEKEYKYNPYTMFSILVA